MKFDTKSVIHFLGSWTLTPVCGASLNVGKFTQIKEDVSCKRCRKEMGWE